MRNPAGLMIIAVLAAGCGDGGSSGTSAADPAPAPEVVSPAAPAPDAGAGATVVADVVARGFQFIDGDVIVALGGELTWVNEDSAAHPLVFSDGRRFDLPGGGSTTVRFEESGVFSFACAIHSNMTGIVTVLQADGSMPPADEAADAGSGSGRPADDYGY